MVGLLEIESNRSVIVSIEALNLAISVVWLVWAVRIFSTSVAMAVVSTVTLITGAAAGGFREGDVT